MELAEVGRLHFFDEGPRDGALAPLVFVHGWGSAAEVFAPQLAAFADERRVLALDLPCHGSSEDDLTCTTYARQARVLAAWLEALGLERMVLVGWSFGAVCAAEYVRRYGMGRLAGFVVVDQSALPLAEDASEYRGNSLEKFRIQRAENLDTSEHLARFVERNFVDGIFFDTPPRAPELRRRLVELACRVPPSVADALFMDGHLADERAVMQEICAEMCVLWFVARYRKEQGLRCVARDFPQAQCVALGNHMMFWEYPREFNATLAAYLSDHRL